MEEKGIPKLELVMDYIFSLANIEDFLAYNPELRKALSEYDFKKIITDYCNVYEQTTIGNYEAIIKTFYEIEIKISNFQKKNNYASFNNLRSLKEVKESGILETMSKKERSCVCIKIIIGYNGERLRLSAHEKAKARVKNIDEYLKKKKA